MENSLSFLQFLFFDLTLTMPLGRTADGMTVRPDFLPMWAGQGASAVQEISAGDLVQKLIVDAQSLR